MLSLSGRNSGISRCALSDVSHACHQLYLLAFRQLGLQHHLHHEQMSQHAQATASDMLLEHMLVVVDHSASHEHM